MRLIETPLKDAFVIELDAKQDDRGSFCRLFCSDFLKSHGLTDSQFTQVNLSHNLLLGTLRGMHFQAIPFLEAKIVYALQGKVFDVIIDLRPESPTYLKHFSITLAQNSAKTLFIPKGFAHGFLTLEDNSTLLYFMSEAYRAGYERGYRYDDPAFGIEWPFLPKVISAKDQAYHSFEEYHALV